MYQGNDLRHAHKKQNCRGQIFWTSSSQHCFNTLTPAARMLRLAYFVADVVLQLVNLFTRKFAQTNLIFLIEVEQIMMQFIKGII